jgi:20S proteasome alpha/beta subunit
MDLDVSLNLGIRALLDVFEGVSHNIEVEYMQPNEKFLTLNEKQAIENISRIEKKKKLSR